MPRIGCPEESEPQSGGPYGVVKDDEAIVVVLISPRTSNERSLILLSQSALKNSDFSVCRAGYSSFEEVKTKVISPQVSKSGNVYKGYHWAPCGEIRDIKAKANEGEALADCGAFCVVDDALDHYDAHAVLGFSKPDIKKFWEKNSRTAARGDLALVLQKRGVFQSHSQPPFP